MELEKIKEVAKELDDALETKNIDQILPFFSDDCEIELLGITVKGEEGVRRWLKWQYEHVAEVKLLPVIIMIEGNVFFEEFVVNAKLHDGTEAESKQAEVLIYDENYRVKSLRLYFDRLDFANSVVRDPISKFIVKRLIKMSLKGLS
jgi:ketosteroid isomerase-like protein